MSDVHLVNPMWDASGGSEWRCGTLWKLLRAHTTAHIWSEHDVDPLLAESFDVRRIGGPHGHPREGNLVVVGPYFPLGDWIRDTRFRRAVIVYNVDQPEWLHERRAQLLDAGVTRIETVYASRALFESIGLPGPVEDSWIDTRRFRPRERRDEGPFVVGRMSRDVPEKHHRRDPKLYRRLVADGCRVRVMGATCLREAGAGVTPGLELLPASSEPAERFLHSLDCFLYRVSDQYFEPSGRVVGEALACGLPVVASRRGGYTAWIEHGVSGFLFDRDREARRLVRRLRDAPELCAEIGDNARRAALDRYSAARARELAEFYLA